MRFGRRGLIVVCLALLLTGLGVRWSAAETAPASTTAPTAVAQPASAQAYKLPPDKLAKAIALNRIRNILDIAGSLWGIVCFGCCWPRAALPGWRAGRRGFRAADGFRERSFSPPSLSSPRWPACRWTGSGTITNALTGSACRGGESWFGDQAKALGLTILFGAPILLLFNWIVRRWPRRYWLGIWVVTLPILVFVLFAEPVVFEPLFDKFEPLSQSNPALVAEAGEGGCAHGNKYSARSHVSDEGQREDQRAECLCERDRRHQADCGVGYDGRAHSRRRGAVHLWPRERALCAASHLEGFCRHRCRAVLHLLGVRGVCGVAGEAVRGAETGVLQDGVCSSRAGFVVLLFAISIAGFVLEPAGNAFSRHFEHQADVYGQEAIHGIVPDPQKTAVAAFNDLGEAWLEDPNPNPFIEFWLYSHPSMEHRADFALHYDPWANGGHGEFFKN